MKMRGQIWGYDLIVAAALFIATLGLLLLFWWNISGTISSGRTGSAPFEQANRLADTLLSPGNPSDWNSTIDTGDPSTWFVISKLGIIRDFQSNEITPEKADAMIDMGQTDYPALKGVLRTNFQYYIEVKEFYYCGDSGVMNSDINCTARGLSPSDDEWNGREHFARVFNRNFSLGLPPDSTARAVASVPRFALYNGSLVRMRVVLWTSQAFQ